jgi:hypothetical protein
MKQREVREERARKAANNEMVNLEVWPCVRIINIYASSPAQTGVHTYPPPGIRVLCYKHYVQDKELPFC